MILVLETLELVVCSAKACLLADWHLGPDIAQFDYCEDFLKDCDECEGPVKLTTLLPSPKPPIPWEWAGSKPLLLGLERLL
jgi:hypothetical protein